MFLAYAPRYGHALTSRELYLPQSWAQDPERRRAAGVPDRVEFTSKPAQAQAQAMIARALEAGVPFAWFTADEACGQARWLQAWLEDRGVPYVMAIRRRDTLTTPADEQRADALATAVPARSWQQIPAGAGAHGLRGWGTSLTWRNSWRCGGGNCCAAGCRGTACPDLSPVASVRNDPHPAPATGHAPESPAARRPSTATASRPVAGGTPKDGTYAVRGEVRSPNRQRTIMGVSRNPSDQVGKYADAGQP